MSKKELEIKSEQLHEAVQKAIADNNFKLVSELLLKEAEVNNQLTELELEELKKTATVLSNLAQKFNMFIGSTLQLAESPTPPLNMNINDISGSRTVKEVLDTLCLIKEVNKSTYDQYEISDEEDAEIYQPLEIPKLSNTKYYACVVDKNRAGAKPKVLFRLNLDFNRWEEVGYVRYKQVKGENE